MLNLIYLQSADTFRLQGLKQFKWQRRKMWEHLKIRWKETYMKLELWRDSLKEVEGNFGTGVVAFFLFVKWLMFLNFSVTILIIMFILLPTVFLSKEEDYTTCFVNSLYDYNNNNTIAECCSDLNGNSSVSITEASLFDFVQGTGWMEYTYLFYRIYPHTVLLNDLFDYNLPLAYISVALFCFLLTLAAILKSATRGFKERLIEGEGQFYYYCNLIFGGWDFCIQNECSAAIKHKALYHEIKGSLESERREEEKRNRSKEERLKLFMVRTIINCIVIVVLIFSGILIFITYTFSLEMLEEKREKQSVPKYYLLLLEFAPSMCIVGLNLVVPSVFKYLVSYEHYSPIFVVRITLFRTVLLRLSSLGVLMASFYVSVKCQIHSDGDCSNRTDCEFPPCWEVYIGKQMYKLLILDTASNILITFVLNFPRMLVAKHINCKLARVIGVQEFQLPKHVLDVVYTQTLCWLGSFYAPLLPAITTVVFIIIFYVKKFSCLVNCNPSSTIYRASRSNSMFMSVLLISFIVAVIPWAYSISEITPSKSCGPFKGNPSAWFIMENTFNNFPGWIKLIVDFCTTAAFAVPVFVILVLCLYYYYAVAAANKHMVFVLKKQLVLEGHDKQFLLNRLSAFIKQQQERHKAVRSIEVPNS